MPVSGALTQLSAQGPQNKYLTIDPQITFWKGSVRRHSHFAVAEIDNGFNGATGCGRKMTALVNRSGDLVSRAYFYFQLKPIEYHPSMVSDGFANNVAYYTNYVGHAAIDCVNYEVGGHPFDEHSGEYLEMLEQVSSTQEKKLGDQVGQADTREQLIDYGKRTQHIYVPLQFDWNRHTEHALPLIALQYHDVKINVRTRRAEELIVRSGEANNPATLAQPGDMCEMTLLLNYVFLDAMERRMFAQQMHEYLVDEVQHSSSESHTAGVSSQHVRLNFNHPVKELLWVVQRDSAITPTPYTGPGALGLSAAHATPFNGQIRVYAPNHNVHRVVSGMMGKLYAN
ncbi:major capsid protein [Acanthamoeba castellanii str. Neff]|uniref:Major capsid protein n=1 Tax=Acanthamoeba castellanii (strain ATCC 30010 / Neff) TaxID=1257118 RepID=L8GRF1_ACACF|nr:major capsid protein [Acanthamoeba castellanii str. Neff]ELR14706.1 major capsid protein [Acanthamoeba castellanii str. Neff]